VWPELIIVSTPILHLCPRVVKAHEPVSVQALGAELAIKTLDVAVVSRLAWPREVEHEIAKQALAPAGMMITRIKVTAVPSIVLRPTFFDRPSALADIGHPSSRRRQHKGSSSSHNNAIIDRRGRGIEMSQ